VNEDISYQRNHISLNFVLHFLKKYIILRVRDINQIDMNTCRSGPVCLESSVVAQLINDCYLNCDINEY
jgi:hypothetical protein